MNLATDAILKVKDAELKAKEILEKAHKDANHQTAIMEIFVLIYFFYNDNLAVGRGYDNLFGLVSFRETAHRTTVEVEHNDIN